MPDPYCLAMVIADAAHRDPATGKTTILGTFSTVNAKSYPAPLRMCVYWAITDAAGDPLTFTLRLVDSGHIFDDTVEPVFIAPFEISCDNPLGVLEGYADINTQLPSPGVYHCELLLGETVLMSRRLSAVVPPSEMEADDNGD